MRHLLLNSSAISMFALLSIGEAARAEVPTELPQIDVSAESPTTAKSKVKAKEGSAEAGYKPETAKTAGPWGDKPILDTPYSIHTTSSALIENMISGSTDQFLKFDPLVKAGWGSTVSGFLSTSLRGFWNSEVTRDGIPVRYSWLSTDVEDLERIEVLTGLSGFLYGSGNVGGLINLVSKRPTKEPLANLSGGNYGGGQYFVHADLGGPIDKEGRFAYRLNFANVDGSTAVSSQKLNRKLVSGALDWQVTDNFLLQVDGSHSEYKLFGSSGFFALWGVQQYPSASDYDNRRSLTPNWGFQAIDANRVGANVRWDIDGATTLRAGYLYLEERRNIAIPTALWIQANGTVWLGNSKWVDFLDQNTGGYAYIDRRFDTFSVEHKLTFGTNFSGYELWPHKDGNLYYEVLYPSIQAAMLAPEYAWPTAGKEPRYLQSKFDNLNVVLGDDIRINDQLSALLGVNYSNMTAKSYKTTGELTSKYDKSAFTPSFSLVYKPWSNVSTYGTYMESMEQGPIVSDSATPSYTNGGQILAPTISNQIEFGAKSEVGGTLLTAAIFQIDKANSFDRYNADGTRTMTQDGRQVHKGIELTATGKITDDLTIFGGATFLDARIKKSNTSTAEGKIPVGVARNKASLYAEYRLPFMEGLFLTGGASYTGNIYLDTVNEHITPAFVVGDVGFRYETKIYDKTFIARMNVSNVSDHRYWIGASTSVALGQPRTVSFSATIKF